MPSLGQGRYAAWHDSIPILDLHYLKEHPLRNTIKSSSPTQVLLHTPPVIGSQGNLNSCVGWALCYAGASIRLYDNIPDWDIALCSPSYLFNQYKHSEASVDTTNCDSVSSNILYLGYWLSKKGTCSYAQMPYTTDCNLQPTTPQKVDAFNRRFSVNQLPVTNDTSWYKQALRKGWPIVVGMPTYDSFLSMWSDTASHGAWNSIDTTLYNHNAPWHATCIVGYDDEKDAFKVMNSWGDSLGDHGFYWAKYSVVEQGAFRDAVTVMVRDSAKIEGPYDLTSHAWYYLRNVPAGATITWSVTNKNGATLGFVFDSANGLDSIKVKYGSLMPGPPTPGLGFGDSTSIRVLPPIYQYGHLHVTVSSGTTSYTTHKTIRRKTGGSKDANISCSQESNLLNISLTIGNEPDYNYTLELWSPVFGLMQTKVVQSATEQMSTAGLPQGVYVILLKENGTPVAETKVIIQ